MTDDQMDILERVSFLKEKAKAAQSQLEQAKVRRAVLQDRLNSLNDRLRKAVGHADWQKARSTLRTLQINAQDALEALAEKLDGVDFD